MILDRWPLRHTGYLHFETLDSTNREAFRQRDDGLISDCWIVADMQTAGRGRHGKPWASLPGNLLASFCVRLEGPASRLTMISLLAGVAVHTATMSVSGDRLAGERVCLKWTNDVLIDGAKLCGILVESRPATGAGQDVWDVVIGVGVNIIDCPSSEVGYRATCLRHHGIAVTRDQLLIAVAEAMDTELAIWRDGGVAEVRRSWMERACHIGEMVDLVDNNAVHTGRFTGIDDSGALLMIDERGNERIHTTGHLMFAVSVAEKGKA